YPRLGSRRSPRTICKPPRGHFNKPLGEKKGFTLPLRGALALLQRPCPCPLKGEDAVPVILHADHCPALVLCFIIEPLGEGADLGVRQALSRSIGVLRLC